MNSADIQYGQRLLSSAAGAAFLRSRYSPLAVLSPHVHLSHLYPRGVVDDAVHDGVGVDAAAEPGMPVLLLELRAEDCGGLLESPLHHLEQPFVQHEQLEVRHLPHELGVAPGLIDGEPALLYSVTSKST